MTSRNYFTIGTIIGFFVFFGIWIYSLFSWGLLLGIVFGWIPAIIAAFVAGLFWGVAAAIILLLIGLYISLTLMGLSI